MLQINGKPSLIDGFYVTEKYDGYDTLTFDISKKDALFSSVIEGAVVKHKNQYVVNKISGSGKSLNVVCELDLRDFRADTVENYSNTSGTITTTMADALPSGWSFVNAAESTVSRTVEVSYGTKLDLVKACAEQYAVSMRFDVPNKTVTAVDPASYVKSAAFITEELNLRSVQYFGDATDFITCLKCRGKSGLTFADINDGKDYVENHQYSADMVYGWLVADDYVDAATMLADATTLIATRSMPVRSYECDVVDLKSIDPAKYSGQDLSLYQVASLKDIDRNTETDYQVVERKNYPYYPEKNVVTLSTAAPKLSTKLQELEKEIITLGLQDNTGWLTGDTGGYLFMVRNDDGQPIALVWMDALTQGAATKAFRIDNEGLKYCPTGPSGTFVKVIDLDGSKINADYLQTGSIQSGNYAESDGAATAGMKIQLLDGVIKAKNFNIDSSGNPTFSGTIYADAGEIGGFLVDDEGLYAGSGATLIRLSSADPASAGLRLSGQVMTASAIPYDDAGLCMNFSAGINCTTSIIVGSRLYMASPASASGTANVRLVQLASGNYSLGLITSSERYKKNIRPVSEDVADRIDRVPAVAYEPRSGLERDHSFYGFTAEAMDAEFPWLVEYKPDSTGFIRPESVQYDRVPTMLWVDAQHSHEKIRRLQADNDDLRERIARLEALCTKEQI